MPVERIPITSREQWLALRKKDVTASVVGALWGFHPYETVAGLWAEKSGILHHSTEETPVTQRGRRLEPVVAEMVAEIRPTWRVKKADVYLRDPNLRFGATPDYEYRDDRGRRGILQIKTCSPQQFEAHWTETDPPLWIALQTLAEMHLDDAEIGTIALLVIDAWTFDLHLYEVPRHAAAEARIVAAIEKFWRETDRGNQPEFDNNRDGDLLAALYPNHVPAKIMDLPTEAAGVLERYARMDEALKMAKAAQEEDSNRLRAWLKDAEAGFLIDKDGSQWVVSLKAQTRKAHAVKESSFRKLRVKKVDKNERNRSD